MTWLAFFILQYGFWTYPTWSNWIVTHVALIAIVGAELQVIHLGLPLLEASGQVTYPIYLLAPYRLAMVSAGCVVAYFWSIFPFPTTDRELLRKELGSIMFFLAKYHSCGNRLMELGMLSPGHPGGDDGAIKSLQKLQRRNYVRLMTVLPSLQGHARFQKWEITVGGKFPWHQYQSIIQKCVK